jgi:sugar/nucleoside kinase (ribokinase family)
VLLTDFGHGTVDKGMIDILSENARFLAVNAQTNSANAGYNLITKFPRADYICIDEPELRLAVADRGGDLPTLMARVAKRLNCQKVSITRGAHGTIAYSAKEGFFEVPVFSNKVIDTVGAGDAYLSVTAPCVADGFSMDVVGFVGNVVGSLAVQIVGNRSPVDPVAIYKSLTAMLG